MMIKGGELIWQEEAVAEATQEEVLAVAIQEEALVAAEDVQAVSAVGVQVVSVEDFKRSKPPFIILRRFKKLVLRTADTTSTTGILWQTDKKGVPWFARFITMRMYVWFPYICDDFYRRIIFSVRWFVRR